MRDRELLRHHAYVVLDHVLGIVGEVRRPIEVRRVARKLHIDHRTIAKALTLLTARRYLVADSRWGLVRVLSAGPGPATDAAPRAASPVP